MNRKPLVLFAAALSGAALLSLVAASLDTERASAQTKSPTPSSYKSMISAAIGAILQADGPKARALLQQLPAADLDTKDQQFRTCVLGRLDPDNTNGGAPEPSNLLARRILDAYRTYWRRAVIQPDKREEAEQALLQSLREALNRPDLQDVSSAEPILSQRLKALGYYSLEGKTGRLRELMLWSKQNSRDYHVDLPDGVQITRVFLLDGFVSLGWSTYLTCDRSGTGGWTKPEGIYVVVPAYKSLEDENFRVNFLAHESHQFADLKRFPGLKSWELEYRAELVELALANTTLERTLDMFISNQSDDPNEPHSYSDRQVLSALRRRLGLSPDADLRTVPVKALQKAAVEELLADTARRTAQKRESAGTR